MAAVCVIALGCDRRPPVVRLTFTTPGAAMATAVDATVGQPLLRSEATVPHVDHIAVISSTAKLELYLVGSPGCNRVDLARDATIAAASAALPAGTVLSTVTHLPPGSAIPTPTAAMANSMTIDIDPDRAAAAGTSVQAIVAAFEARSHDRSTPAGGNTVEELEAVPIPAADGSHVPLGSVARVTNHPQRAMLRRDL